MVLIRSTALLFFVGLSLSPTNHGEAFSTIPHSKRQSTSFILDSSTSTGPTRRLVSATTSRLFGSTESVENNNASVDCGCGAEPTLYSGKPSSAATLLNLRQAIRGQSIFSVSGDEVSMDVLIGNPEDGQTSIVVFLRSLG